MSVLRDLEIHLSPDGRWIGRRGDAGRVSLSAMQARIVAYIDRESRPTLAGLIDEELPGATPDWARGFIEKLSNLLVSVVGLLLVVGPSGDIQLLLPSAGPSLASAPTAPLPVEVKLEAPAFVGGEAMTARLAAVERELGILKDENLRLSAERDALERLRLEIVAENDRLHRDLEAVIADNDIAGRQLAELRAQVAAPTAAPVAAPSPTWRDAPLAIAPKHVTIPVSESLWEWLEGNALRNRCSPEHLVSRLVLAFRKAAIEDARAGTRGRAA